MATANPKETRARVRPTLQYIYRGVGHAHQVNKIRHIGGSIFSKSPIVYDADGEAIGADISEMADEFTAHAQINKGRARKKFKHYVIGLAPGEHLETSQWARLVKDYMSALGYNRCTKWAAVVHDDSDCQHVHIVSCLVDSEKLGGALVSTSKDYQRGWSIMRKFETLYGLRDLQNPDENFGFNFSKRQMKAMRGRQNAIKRDDGAIIRARFKHLYENEGKPETMTQLVLGLARRGVAMKVRQSSDGETVGVSYRADQGSWISGSNVKAYRFTWAKLQSKERINYNFSRDNPALGIGNDQHEIVASIEIPDRRLRLMMSRHMPYQVKKRKDRFYVDIEFLTHQEAEVVQSVHAIIGYIEHIFEGEGYKLHLGLADLGEVVYEGPYIKKHTLPDPATDVLMAKRIGIAIDSRFDAPEYGPR